MGAPKPARKPTGFVLARLALLALLATSTGCGLIGMGVGSAVPRSETIVVTSETPLPEIGERVRVHVTRAGGSDEWIAGRYDGVREGAFIVSNSSGEHAIVIGSIREIEKRRGSYWGTGLAIGVVIDVIVTGALVAAAVDLSRGGTQ